MTTSLKPYMAIDPAAGIDMSGTLTMRSDHGEIRALDDFISSQPPLPVRYEDIEKIVEEMRKTVDIRTHNLSIYPRVLVSTVERAALLPNAAKRKVLLLC